MEVVLYGRTSYVNDNILTFLRFSRNDYYSICLDYCNSSNFEQIIKAPHYALPSYVVFYRNYTVAHISVALIFYLYYTDFFLFCQMLFFIYWPLKANRLNTFSAPYLPIISWFNDKSLITISCKFSYTIKKSTRFYLLIDFHIYLLYLLEQIHHWSR